MSKKRKGYLQQWAIFEILQKLLKYLPTFGAILKDNYVSKTAMATF